MTFKEGSPEHRLVQLDDSINTMAHNDARNVNHAPALEAARAERATLAGSMTPDQHAAVREHVRGRQAESSAAYDHMIRAGAAHKESRSMASSLPEGPTKGAAMGYTRMADQHSSKASSAYYSGDHAAAAHHADQAVEAAGRVSNLFRDRRQTKAPQGGEPGLTSL